MLSEFFWCFIGKLVYAHAVTDFTFGKFVIVFDNALHVRLEYLETLDFFIAFVVALMLGLDEFIRLI